MPVEAPFMLADWVVDPAANRLRRDGTEIRLEPKVMRVLGFLVEQRGRVVSRRELEAQVWRRAIVSDDAVTNTVIKLRKALGDDARNPSYIETIAKTGYRLIAEVSPLPAAAAREPERPPSAEPARTPSPRSESFGSRSLESGPSDLQAPPREPAPLPARPGRESLQARRAFWPWLLGALVLAAVALVWLTQPAPPVGDAPLPLRPVVAVLPFENLSADPEQDYFSDGITEDLITELSKLSGLQVVARNSVLAFRDYTAPERQIGAELGARYIVKGSVQRAGERLRINVRLSDALAGRNRWAERYDRDLADLFAVQDEIAARVASALQVELAPAERQRLSRKFVAGIEAYDQFLRGLDLLGRRSITDNAEAKAYFERAIELDPRFARAYAGLALAYSQDAVHGVGPTAATSLAQAEAIVRTALELDATLPQARYVLSLVELYKGNLAAAIAEVSRAIEYKPSYADGYGLQAWILHFAGRTDDGLEAMRQAVALNPQMPSLYRTVKAALHYQREELDQALEQLHASIEISPNQFLTRLFLAAVYTAEGDLAAARWQVEEIRALNPQFSLADLEHGFPIRDPAYRSRFLADLRRAGLGE